MLAEAVPSALEVGGFVLTTMTVLIALNQGREFIMSFRDKSDYVSKREHADLVAEFSKLRDEVNTDRQAVQQSAEARANRIFDQVNAITGSVRELTGVVSEIRRKDP